MRADAKPGTRPHGRCARDRPAASREVRCANASDGGCWREPRISAVEWLAKTGDVQVRVNTLAPHEGTPWHFHSFVTDDVFCLEEGLEVSLRVPDEVIPLQPGDRRTIAPGRIHRVVNVSDRPVRYLLVQATGRYDFNEVT